MVVDSGKWWWPAVVDGGRPWQATTVTDSGGQRQQTMQSVVVIGNGRWQLVVVDGGPCLNKMYVFCTWGMILVYIYNTHSSSIYKLYISRVLNFTIALLFKYTCYVFQNLLIKILKNCYTLFRIGVLYIEEKCYLNSNFLSFHINSLLFTI